MVPLSTRWGNAIVAALVAVLAAPAPAVAAEGASAPAAQSPVGSGRLKAKVLGSDGKTPIAGAIVRGYHLDGGKVYSSLPTGAKGECELAGIPFGYVDIYIETKDGTFVGNQVVNVPPGGTVALSYTLTRYAERDLAWWNGKNPREIPGTHTASQGIAEVRLKAAGQEFWKGPKGIAVIAGASAALLFAVSGGGTSATASPSTP
ncbi:MAG: hypothetical protein LAO51_11670 [Acidobacteriia bacterium]|nr:hypothetical protein [Terriglobia bacterium]